MIYGNKVTIYSSTLILLLLALVSWLNTYKDSPQTANFGELQRITNEFEMLKEEKVEKKKIKLLPPDSGVYLGAFADFGPHEDNVTVNTVRDFENMINKKIAWAYFSDNWFDGISFPVSQVEVLKDLNVTPYIRIMPRINFNKQGKNSPYTLESIAGGDFDTEIRKWAITAKESEIPIILEFGTEVNGDWFPWNGRWNTTNDDFNSGPEIFKKSYRHIIDIFNSENVNNVTWVYHTNAISSPDAEWNNAMNYYPGDEYIDWIGVSVYGAQNKTQTWISFDDVYAPVYGQITSITNKPIAIVELGVSESGDDSNAKPVWIETALNSLQKNLYPNTKGVSYWHSQWVGNDGMDYNLKLDSSTQSLNSFSELVMDDYFISNTMFLD